MKLLTIKAISGRNNIIAYAPVNDDTTKIMNQMFEYIKPDPGYYKRTSEPIICKY